MSLRYAILGLLSQRSGSGYDLLKRFEGSLAHVWPATQSQVYSELSKLADGKFIEVVGQGTRHRTDYAITAAGREELRSWLAEPVIDHPRSASLLQVFLLSETSPEVAKAHFEALRAAAAAQAEELRHLEETVTWDDSAADRYGRLVLRYGILRAEADARWAEECLVTP